MVTMITGYNLPHLAEFNTQELETLANVLPKGLTYRLYGGEESRHYQHIQKVNNFLSLVDGRVITVWTPEQPRFGAVTQFDNELYLFEPPNIFKHGFWQWFDYNFRKAKYYTDLANKHIAFFKQWKPEGGVIVSLPLKVNQNPGFRAYAQAWLNSPHQFDVDLHIFGGDPGKVRDNLNWYKQRSSRKIHILEFNGLENDRMESINKNSDYHRQKHSALLSTIENTLGNQLGDVLYFTLGTNQTSLNWRNPPFLHKYELDGDIITNTVNRVF